jgi:hypothetical protein
MAKMRRLNTEVMSTQMTPNLKGPSTFAVFRSEILKIVSDQSGQWIENKILEFCAGNILNIKNFKGQ